MNQDRKMLIVTREKGSNHKEVLLMKEDYYCETT